LADTYTFRKGMQVYGPDNTAIGTIDDFDNDSFMVGGQRYRRDMIDRADRDRFYLRQGYQDQFNQGYQNRLTGQNDREVRVPVAEERLNVEKRAGQIGEVDIHKQVVQERVNVPVELTREEVRVERRDVADRPLRPGENAAFREETIRVPVRGEEAIVNKEAVVTGEVVINKQQQTERRNVSDTVRKERVEVDKDFERARPRFEEHYARRFGNTNERAMGATTERAMGTTERAMGGTTERAMRGTGTTGRARTFEDVEPAYRTGWQARRDPRYAGRRFEEVEPELRRDWQANANPGDRWEELHEAVREGFDLPSA